MVHLVKRHLEVDLLFPDHAKRTESPEHRNVREELIVQRKFPCWICGRNIDDFGGDAQALEIHHLFAEYSEFLDIDPARVNADHPVFASYNNEGAYSDADSLDGSLVLCSLHHRGSTSPGRCESEGIHNSDFDSWEMQRYIRSTALHDYFPGVIVIRKGVSDEHGYLPEFLAQHPDISIPAALPVKKAAKRKPKEQSS